MPKKHINLSESLLGLGAYVLGILSSPMTVDTCWEVINNNYIKKGKILKKHSFDNFILTLDLLFALNAIELNQKGEIFNVYRETELK